MKTLMLLLGIVLGSILGSIVTVIWQVKYFLSFEFIRVPFKEVLTESLDRIIWGDDTPPKKRPTYNDYVNYSNSKNEL